MFIIKIDPEPNGDHQNQISDIPFDSPEGWIIVPPELENEAMSYIPFINLTIVNGKLIAVAQGKIPPPEPPPEPAPDTQEFLLGLMGAD